MMPRVKRADGKPATGFVVYEGPSLLTGRPVVAIAVLRSGNVKTGDMIQLVILTQEADPLEAIRSGADADVCGACVHRARWIVADGKMGERSCYVVLAHLPLGAFKGWKRGIYPPAPPRFAAGRAVRLGAYGDPAALPVSVVRSVLAGATSWTGYTHQWRARRSAGAFRPYLMASVDSEAERLKAQSRGWRTARVAPDDRTGEREIVCPAIRRPDRVTCLDCGLCDGARPGRARTVDIVFPAHGSGAKYVPSYSVEG